MNPLRDNPFNSRLADGIARVGFRKWYERELLSSHAHMLLSFLSLFAMLASIEAFSGASWSEKLMDTGFVILTAAVMLWSLRRYLYLLMRAEDLANQAKCPQCAAYGQFDLVAEDRPARQSRVRCRRCASEWRLIED